MSMTILQRWLLLVRHVGHTLTVVVGLCDGCSRRHGSNRHRLVSL